MRLQTFAWLALLGAAASPYAEAQTQGWIRQLGTDGSESVWSTAPDGAGGLYVSGGTTASLGAPSAGGLDAWFARYDATGHQIWIRQLGTAIHDAASLAASDGAGGLYVMGYTIGSLAGPNAGGVDAWFARYDASGNQTWIRQLGTAEYEIPEGAVPDGAGGVFVTGISYGSLGGPNAGNADVWLAHYDGAGNQSWITQWGTPRFNGSTDAASDGAGGLYVVGHSATAFGGNSDAWVDRFDASGNRTWRQRFGTHAEDYARAAAPDGSGGVYVTGHSGFGLFNDDAWLTRYDSAGNQAWFRVLGTTTGDYSVAAAPDGAGGVIIGGETSASLGGAHMGGEDAWLANYDMAGNQAWIQQLGTQAGDGIAAATRGSTGALFVTGRTSGSLGGSNAGGGDAWLARYDILDAERYCDPAVSNSTGAPGFLTAVGSSLVGANNLTIVAHQLRPFSFGLFLTSPDQGLVTNPAGSQGHLCLGGAIGRYVGPGQVQNSGSAGTIELSLDLTAMPTPTGQVAVQPGDTWNFQAWYRDIHPGPTSNFTDGMSVLFR